MTERAPSGEYDYAAAKLAFQAAIVADGGLMGLFGLMRSDMQLVPTLDRYDVLLRASVTPEERAGNAAAAAEQQPDELGWLDQSYMNVAATKGLLPEDVTAMLMAVVLCQQAFPDIAPERVPHDEASWAAMRQGQ